MCMCPQLLSHVWLFVTPTDCSQPGSSLHGILQVRTQEQVAISWASQVALALRNPPANAGDIRDAGSIPGLGGSLGGGHGNPLQYSCLENPMDKGAWWAVHRVAKSWTWLKWLSTHACHFLLHLTDPGTEPTCLVSPALAGGFFTTVPGGKPGKIHTKQQTSADSVLTRRHLKVSMVCLSHSCCVNAWVPVYRKFHAVKCKVCCISLGGCVLVGLHLLKPDQTSSFSHLSKTVTHSSRLSL